MVVAVLVTGVVVGATVIVVEVAIWEVLGKVAMMTMVTILSRGQWEDYSGGGRIS